MGNQRTWIYGSGALLTLGVSYATLVYFSAFSFLVLAVFVMPFLAYFQGEKSWRFGALAAFSMLLFCLVPSRLLLLFASFFLLFFIVEQWRGKLNWGVPLFLVFASPLASYFFDIFSIEWRFKMTTWAGKLLGLLGKDILVSGNQLVMNGQAFSVDPVCMGLNLLITGFLVSIVLLSLQEILLKKSYSKRQWLLFLLGSLVLVLAANFIRILTLILVQSPAETLGHELIGLGTFCLCMVLPFYAFTRIWPPSLPWNSSTKTERLSIKSLSISLGILISALAFLNHQYPVLAQEKITEPMDLSIPGYDRQIMEFENRSQVLAFQNDQSIIYLKNQSPFRMSNHNPMICWRGSGYELINEQLMEIDGMDVFRAQLIRDHEILETAWWFENEHRATTSNLSWRYYWMADASPFHLVNVTASDFQGLYLAVQQYRNAREE